MKQYMSFIFLMSYLIVSDSCASEPVKHVEECSCSAAEIDEQEAPVIFQASLDNVFFDTQSGTSALEQFLEKGFTYAHLHMPYRWMTLIHQSDVQSKFESLRVVFLVPMDWSSSAHQALLKSDKLAVVVYREMREHANSDSVIDAGKFGIWQCKKKNEYYTRKVS